MSVGLIDGRWFDILARFARAALFFLFFHVFASFTTKIRRKIRKPEKILTIVRNATTIVVGSSPFVRHVNPLF